MMLPIRQSLPHGRGSDYDAPGSDYDAPGSEQSRDPEGAIATPPEATV
jgi:hypothetical protein